MIKHEEESGPSDEKAWGRGHWEPDSRSDLTVENMGSQRFTSKGAGGGRGWGMGGGRPPAKQASRVGTGVSTRTLVVVAAGRVGADSSGVTTTKGGLGIKGERSGLVDGTETRTFRDCQHSLEEGGFGSFITGMLLLQSHLQWGRWGWTPVSTGPGLCSLALQSPLSQVQGLRDHLLFNQLTTPTVHPLCMSLGWPRSRTQAKVTT